MKLISISAKNFSPKKLFRSKKDRSKVSRSEPPSFGSGSSSSSSSGKPRTPTTVLPGPSGDWSDFSDVNSELLQAFKLIAGDNDGIVSQKDLFSLFSPELAMIAGDGDGDGSVSLEELVTRVGSGPACDSELRETFEIFDADHDGKITAEELFSVFSTLGDDRCTLADCRRMIAGVDRNGDGFVCFEDFARMMELQR